MPILIFILLHWYLSAFCQTFFLHRYSAHRMFTMSPAWQKFFYALTFLTQGSSYLNPRAYAVMHRLHHAYSDTERDPHSPVHLKNPVALMRNTLSVYLDVFNRKLRVEDRFEGQYPEWPAFDRVADAIPVRALWAAAYICFYVTFATAWWMYLALPLHFFMGPIHGAIVNWCGHQYGYANFNNRDHSKNTFFFDIFTMGELFQNNHHESASRPNFARRWFEFDPTYILIRLLAWLRVVRLPSP